MAGGVPGLERVKEEVEDCISAIFRGGGIQKSELSGYTAENDQRCLFNIPEASVTRQRERNCTKEIKKLYTSSTWFNKRKRTLSKAALQPFRTNQEANFTINGNSSPSLYQRKRCRNSELHHILISRHKSGNSESTDKMRINCIWQKDERFFIQAHRDEMHLNIARSLEEF